MQKSPLKTILLVILFCLCAKCFAQDGVISSVSILKSKTNPEIWQLNIESSKNLPYKVIQTDNNTVYFDIKNAKLTDDTRTIWGDARGVESVIVKQNDAGTVRISLQGENAANTKITFTKTQTAIPEKKAPAEGAGGSMWFMITAMSLGLIFGIKSLTSKITYDPEGFVSDNFERIRTIDNTKNLKMTIAQLKKANQAEQRKTQKTLDRAAKKEFTSPYKSNKVQYKSTKSLKNSALKTAASSSDNLNKRAKIKV